jgi:Mn-dependent DtxR family transcriptional regulator
MTTKKETFINEIKILIEQAKNCSEMPFEELSSDALDYWNGLQMTGDSGKTRFTENGKLILRYMRENKDIYNNLFKAKDIGEGMGISSRTVSGAMRKLVTDAFVEKIGEAPICYSLTQAGITVNLDETEG